MSFSGISLSRCNKLIRACTACQWKDLILWSHTTVEQRSTSPRQFYYI